MEKRQIVINYGIDRLLFIFILLGLFGYPYIAIFTTLTNLPNTPISIGYRFITLLLGLYIIVYAFLKKGNFQFSVSGWLLLFFWILYGSILINDISFEGLRLKGQSQFYLYSFIFGSSFIGFFVTAISGSFFRMNIRRMYTMILVNLGLTIGLLFLLLKSGTGLSLLAERADIVTENDKSVVNPITIGQYGALQVTLSMCWLFFFSKVTFIKKLFVCISLVIGLICLLVGASKGPIISVLMCVIVIVSIFLKRNLNRPVSLFKFLSVVGGVTVAISTLVLPRLANIDLSVVLRFAQFFNKKMSNKKMVRDYEWEAAWSQFLNNPILGDKYLNNYDNFYPHNVYLEVLMTTGLIGGFFFFLAKTILIFTVVKVLFRLDKSMLIFSLFFVLISFFKVTSGALHQSIDYWIVLGLLSSYNYFNYKPSL